MSTVAVAGIDFYRRYLSPLKGFKCAHHYLHRTGSCSTYGRDVYAKHRLLEATRLLRARFAECKQASIVAKSEIWRDNRPNASRSEDESEREKAKKSRWDSCDCGGMPDVDIGFCDCGF
jgi:putative component of membrane protein insertase Oxa1/YidC/SpoIIIJ protein YidD